MRRVRIAIVVLSALLLGAHVLRQGWWLAAILVAASPLLLVFRQRAADRALQLVLLLGAIEWARTTFVLASLRLAAGAPYLRLVAILGAVALLTAAGAALLEPARERPR